MNQIPALNNPQGVDMPLNKLKHYHPDEKGVSWLCD